MTPFDQQLLSCILSHSDDNRLGVYERKPIVASVEVAVGVSGSPDQLDKKRRRWHRSAP